MRKFFIQTLILSLVSMLFPLLGSAVASAVKIHHFTIIAPPTAKVGEAIDITVEARDKDDKVITTYTDSVYFQSETDFGASVPAQGRAVQFKESDNGVIKLSKAVVFKKVGDQQLSVSSAVDDAVGSVKIKVEEGATATGSGQAESITIMTPEKNSTITSNTVSVSGKTKKNSKVVLKLNGNEVATLVSDETGIFTRTLTDISQSTNILSANILDGNNVVIGSTETMFKMTSAQPQFYNMTVAPSTDVEAGTGVIFTIDAEAGLSVATILLDGAMLTATETSPGKYTTSTTAPAKAGKYPVQVNLKNMLSQTFSKDAVLTLTVKEKVVVAPPAASFKNVQAFADGSRVTLTFSVENLPTETEKFKIAYGESADSLSNEVVTYEKGKIMKGTGTYSWYIDKLEKKSYVFKIFAVKADGSLVSNLASDPVSASVGAGSCTIGNVGKVSVTTSKDTSVLSWEALTGALSYNVYRVTAAKDFELVQNVKENSYTIFLSSGSIAHEDFAVKALCDDKTESSVPSLANRVQTGPGAIAILVVISALASIFLLRKRTSY